MSDIPYQPPALPLKPSPGLELRVFTLVNRLLIATGLVTLGINFVADSAAREYLFSVLVMMIGLLANWTAGRVKLNAYLPITVYVTLLILATIIWFTNHGTHGGGPVYFAMLLIVGCVFLPQPYEGGLTLLAFSILVGVIVLEALLPDLIVPFESQSQRFIDVGGSILIALGGMTLLVRLVIRAFRLERQRSEQLYAQLQSDQQALEQALEELTALRGILPVCSFCKKIRDEHDQWHAIENYITDHSQAQFSHSLCPVCVSKHYPEQD